MRLSAQVHPNRILTAGEAELAASLWDLGRDTHQIAMAMDVAEAAIYRELARQRDAAWLKRRADKLLGVSA